MDVDGFDYSLPNMGKDLTVKPTNGPKSCSFCLASIINARFSAYSKPRMFGMAPEAAICQSCVDRLAMMSRFTRNFQLYYRKHLSYAVLRIRLMRLLNAESGSIAMKRLIIDIVIELLIRKSAKMGGYLGSVCPHTGISLRQRRIALITNNVRRCHKIVKFACEESGLGFLAATPNDIHSGKAYENLITLTGNGEVKWACHDILFCEAYVQAKTDSNVVYACRTIDDIPADIQQFKID